MQKNNIIDSWLDQHGDPDVNKFVSKNLEIVNKVRLALEDKGWSKTQLAKEMGKRPSEVSKWLSGMHNLTLKSIIKMENALGIDLIYTNLPEDANYTVVGVIDLEKAHKAYKEQKENTNYSIGPAETNEFSIAM